MATKKTPLSISQHRKFGILLKKMRDDLILEVLPQVEKSHSKNSAAVRQVMRATYAIDSLRNSLHDTLAAETSREQWEGEGLRCVYFPGNKDSILKG